MDGVAALGALEMDVGEVGDIGNIGDCDVGGAEDCSTPRCRTPMPLPCDHGAQAQCFFRLWSGSLWGSWQLQKL